MSDEVFAKRHEKCEVGERNAFSTSSLVVYTTLHSNELPSPSEWVVTHNMHTGAIDNRAIVLLLLYYLCWCQVHQQLSEFCSAPEPYCTQT